MKKSEKRSNKIKSIVAVIGFLICTLVLLYPLISDRWNQYRDKQIIDRYIDEINTGDSQFFENEMEKAYEYNKSLYSDGKNVISESEYTTDENYENLLNSTGTGIMCYIEIPKIDVTEPVYHYSTDISLDKGVGHIHGSSLPVGGDNTHSVLTGHRGLPSQKIFSDLDRIKKGDNFYIHILGHTLKYRVFDIKVVTPDNVSDLTIQKNKDIITLVTCEPYGINTHRLLIMGNRVEFDETKVENGLVTTEEHQKVIDPALMIFIGFMIFVGLFAVIAVIRTLMAKRKKAPEPVKVKKERVPFTAIFKKKPTDDKQKKPIKKPKIQPPVSHKKHADTSQSPVIETVYIKEEQAQPKHKPFFYIISGITIGLAIAGGIVIVYKLLKGKKDKKSKDKNLDRKGI